MPEGAAGPQFNPYEAPMRPNHPDAKVSRAVEEDATDTPQPHSTAVRSITNKKERPTMKALNYQNIACGTDLHILKRDVPVVQPGHAHLPTTHNGGGDVTCDLA